MSDAEFQCERPFGIDNDELNGLSPQQCFVLGYELAQIDSLLSSGAAFERPVHSGNRERIESNKAMRDREHSLTYMSDDLSENWMWLKVAASVE